MSKREAIGVPAGSTEVEIGGVKLAIAREGKGPAVICLHAIGHGSRDFESFAKAIADRFEVIRIDWPGHGCSGSDLMGPDPSRYAELLAGVVNRLEIREPIIVGNSIGGATALRYAHEHPVRGLVLCDTGGLVQVTATVRRFCGFFERFFAAGVRGAWWFRTAYRAFYRFVVLPSPEAAEQRERIINAGYELAPLLRDAWAGFGRPEADIRNLATSLEVPVWFAWASKDKVIPLGACLPCIRAMKHASLTKFKAGHAPFLEQPAEFTREFLKFTSALQSDDAAAPVRIAG